MNHTDDSTGHNVGSSAPEAKFPAARVSHPAAPSAFAFHSDDVEHVANYQSLCVLALFGLLIGLASLLILVSKVFLLLPLVGAAISLLALRRISLSEGRLAGRWAAIIGLALCVASGATAITRDAVVRSMRTSQAEKFAYDWLTLVASNDTDQAFKTTYEGARPLAPPDPGMPPPEKTPYETFLSDPLIQKIVAAGKDAKIQLVNTLEFIPQTRQDVVVRQQFSIAPAGDSAKAGSTNPITAFLTLQRSHFRGVSESRWLVIRFEPTNAPPK